MFDGQQRAVYVLGTRNSMSHYQEQKSIRQSARSKTEQRQQRGGSWVWWHTLMIPAETDSTQILAHPGLVTQTMERRELKDSSVGKVLDLEARGHQLDPRTHVFNE